MTINRRLVGDQSVSLRAKGIDLEDVCIATVKAGVDHDLKIVVQFLCHVPAELGCNWTVRKGVVASNPEVDLTPRIQHSYFRVPRSRAVLRTVLSERVAAAVKKLKELGLVSPYLRSFVVARINPLRWIKGDPPPLEDVLKTIRERAAKFNVEKIKPQDLAGSAGPPDEET